VSEIKDIYDFFTPIEEAVKAAFVANEIDCFTPSDDPKLQRKRPRIEVALSLAPSQRRLIGVVGTRATPGFVRDAARQGQLDMALVTDAAINIHRDFVSKVLYLCDTLANDANGTGTLTKHFIQSLMVTGSSQEYDSEKGVYITNLTLAIDFSIGVDLPFIPSPVHPGGGVNITAPLFFQNNTLFMPQASASVSGYLSSTDFQTFANSAVSYPITADKGGTGLTTYTAGDLLYASGTTAISKLAAAATGNALLSGTTPSWGKIGLTTHVSGTLAVGNGGTGATSFTAGRILFGNGTGALASSVNLTWNNSTGNFTVGSGAKTFTVVPGQIGSQTDGFVVTNTQDGNGCLMNLVGNTDPVYFNVQSSLGQFLVGSRNARGFLQYGGSQAYVAIEQAGGTLGNFACGWFGSGVENTGADGAQVEISNTTFYILSLDGGDDGSFPSDGSTPIGWLDVLINGVQSWMPYYR
jgi:hypothetical protein